MPINNITQITYTITAGNQAQLNSLFSQLFLKVLGELLIQRDGVIFGKLGEKRAYMANLVTWSKAWHHGTGLQLSDVYFARRKCEYFTLVRRFFDQQHMRGCSLTKSAFHAIYIGTNKALIRTIYMKTHRKLRDVSVPAPNYGCISRQGCQIPAKSRAFSEISLFITVFAR